MTAYARECERAGVRISRWREETGCRNVKPFKYSAEHASAESSATRDVNATYNEVLTDLDDGLEEEDGDEPLDLRGLHHSLPAYRHSAQVEALSSSEVDEDSRDRRRRKQRRRRPRKKNRNSLNTFVRKHKRHRESQRSSLGSYKGFTIETVSSGGSKRRLKWGGKKKYNLIDMLLSSVDDDDDDDDRVSDSYDDDTEYNEDYEEADDHGLSLADLPQNKQRSKPPPLHESGQSRSISLSENKSNNIFFSNHNRRNYKRRRHTRSED